MNLSGRITGVCLSVLLAASVARAEGVGVAGKDRSTGDRVYGVFTVMPTATGLIGVGGPALRRLVPGARRWEALHTVPGDNLYRVTADDSGRLLAAWSREPLIHLIEPDTKQRVSFAKPTAPRDVENFDLSDLVFAANGREAFVVMNGNVRLKTARYSGPSRTVTIYRMPLDGAGPPALIFRIDQAFRLHVSPFGAVFALHNVGQKCDSHECSIPGVVAVDFTDTGVKRKTLLDSSVEPWHRARVVRGSPKDEFLVMLSAWLSGRGALLRWRYGTDRATVTKRSPPGDRTTLFQTRDGRLLEFRVQDGLMEIWSGDQQLANVREMQDIDTGLYGVGERSDGSLWFHWGDHIGLFVPGQTLRGYSVRTRLPRRSDWTGNVYVESPEQLWLGIDGTGRHFERVDFAAIERGAKPWPAGRLVERTHGEYAGYNPKDPSTADRLWNASWLKPMKGGLFSFGGGALRQLIHGERRWRVLHAIPKDNLYRVAADDSGRILAAWEADPDIHVFDKGQHLTFTKPKPRQPFMGDGFQVDDIAFLPNGRDILLTMTGQVKNPQSRAVPEPVRFYYSSWATEVYRVPLDGKFQPQLLYREDHAYRVHESNRGTIFAMPKYPGQDCQWSTCFPITEIVAYEVSDAGVKKTTLLRGDAFGPGVYLSQAGAVKGSNDQHVAMVVGFTKYNGKHWLGGGRGLLRWRWGEAKADYRPLPGNSAITPMWLLTRDNDFVELIEDWTAEPDRLEIKRYLADGSEQSTVLTALRKLPSPKGLGELADGGLWLQWGDHLALLRPGQPPKSYDLDALVDRGTEWAGAHSYVPEPESLWVGLDGRGRRYVRVDLAAAEKKAKVWR